MIRTCSSIVLLLHYFFLTHGAPIGCSEVWECYPAATLDVNFVDCDNGNCVCREGFAGSATTEDKCRCEGTLAWVDAAPSCAPPGKCIADYHWMCLSGAEDYNFVHCNEDDCSCITERGFVGSATPQNPCRCEGTVVWDDDVASCEI